LTVCDLIKDVDEGEALDMESKLGSMWLRDVKKALTEPEAETFAPSGEYGATFDALGLYSPSQFVVRLNPKIHELVDALGAGDLESRDPDEVFSAYSTFLHETVHWWQHIGSTSGLIMSLCYPAQWTSTIEPLRAVVHKYGPIKPLKPWAEARLRQGGLAADAELLDANHAVNNFLDIEFYEDFATNPLRTAPQLFENPYFECIGHSYGIAYANTLRALIDTCGFAPGSLPDPAIWEEHLDDLREARHEGFYRGSPIRRARVGLRDIYEGQARFNQMQMLLATGGPAKCAQYRDAGYFEGCYVSAFEEFLRLTGFIWPEQIDDPKIALFLLICDLAINPTRGIPLPIEKPVSILGDIDPGMRFDQLCRTVSTRPELASVIQSGSHDEYIRVSHALTWASGYDHPMEALSTVIALINSDAGAATLTAEWETFCFPTTNLPFRLIAAAFLSFCRDKFEHPEYFCWPGIYWVDRQKSGSAVVFQRNLPLFVDRADTERIHARVLPGREGEPVWDARTAFFGQLLICELAKQWVLGNGPFRYEYYWLTGTHQNDELIAFAKAGFERTYGVHPDAFDKGANDAE
jgi:hypothetical protein